MRARRLPTQLEQLVTEYLLLTILLRPLIIMGLSKEEFVTLWNIHNSWQCDPLKASDGTTEGLKQAVRIFQRLDELGFIKIEVRDNQIYGAVATKKGEQTLEKKEYSAWTADL